MKRLLALAFVIIMTGTVYALPPIEFGEGQRIKIGYEGQFGMSFRDMGSGPNAEGNTTDFNFRRNRINLIGSYNEWLGYYVQTEYMESRKVNPFYVDPSDGGREFYLLDAQIRLDMKSYLHFVVGKFKHNLTRENLEACFEPLTNDRSLFVYTPFKTSRDMGVAVWGNLANDKFQYRLDIMEGQTGTGGDPEDSGFRYTARVQASLFDPENGYGMAGTYLGMKQVLTFGAAIQYEPDALYGDVGNLEDSADYLAYTFDVFYEQPIGYGALTLSAAYLEIDFDDAYLGADPSRNSFGLNGQKKGWYVKAGYLLPFDVGPGMLQPFARYDDFQFANFQNAQSYQDFYDQQITRMAIGFNYYIFNQDMKVTAEYSMLDYDKEDPDDVNYQDFSSFELYLQVRF
jgi:hypothetical protein